MNANRFRELVESEIDPLNDEQAQCLDHPPDTPLFVVAGPGSGKTRVLVQRALRHVLVDRILPEHIVITTFTRKAAKEIRSRLIEWGQRVLAAARIEAEQSDGADDLLAHLDAVDINRFVTGTLDALCEEALNASRTPSEPRLSLIDEFAAKTLLARKGRLREEMAGDAAIADFLSGFTFDGKPPRPGSADAIREVKTISDRFVHDRVDPAAIADNGDPGLRGVLRVAERFDQYLEDAGLLDFARLERLVHDRLADGREVGALTDARAVLVDEYQDTNLLQEQIYFAIARRTGAALTVVGDDDQALYRFRGATIELFRHFAERARTALGVPDVGTVHLARNYRSTQTIVDFFNRYIVNDENFHPAARVQPLKPLIIASSGREPFPVLGIFRDGPEEVAQAAGAFLGAVFSATGFAKDDLVLRGSTNGGDYGDAVLLGKSVEEFSKPYGDNPPKARLAHYLRRQLEGRGVRVFNPRGRGLHDINAVATLLGLLLEAIDPSTPGEPQGPIGADLHLQTKVRTVLARWRTAAAAFLASAPRALSGKVLGDHLQEKQALCRPGGTGPRDFPVLDLIYAFVPYVEPFSDDPEHQVYLEVITRTAAQMASFSAYRGLIVRQNPANTRSLESVYFDMLRPLAAGEIDVDEDILPEIPRNCFNVMTIHQSKGLEFPLVLVDVSSGFAKNNHAQKFKRFPEAPSATTKLENALAGHTSVGALRMKRSALDRSFEDLIREHYVAYSRPESVLVLLGHANTLRSKTPIRCVGQFWRQDGRWAWTDGFPKQKPPSHANIPFVRI